MTETYTTGTIFRHYKGNLYAFLYEAKHSETREELIVYKALYGEYGIWVRPKKMFFEMIEVNEEVVQRFAVNQNQE